MTLGALAIASCGAGDVTPRPPEIRRIDVTGDHLQADVLVTDAADPADLLPAIAAGVRQVRGRLAPGIRTVTIDVRFIPYGEQGEQPLAAIDYDGGALERVSDRTPAAELLELARGARARPPIGDLRIREECTSAEPALRSSTLCADAGG